MGIEHEAHGLLSRGNSRGKLPHISRRASLMSSSLTWKPISAYNPNKLFRGVLGSGSASWVTNCRTSSCFSGGSS